MDRATKHISEEMTRWTISSHVLREPREKRFKSAERTGGDGKTSGSMFSWLLRDPQSVRWGLYMFSRVDISGRG